LRRFAEHVTTAEVGEVVGGITQAELVGGRVRGEQIELSALQFRIQLKKSGALVGAVVRAHLCRNSCFGETSGITSGTAARPTCVFFIRCFVYVVNVMGRSDTLLALLRARSSLRLKNGSGRDDAIYRRRDYWKGAPAFESDRAMELC